MSQKNNLRASDLGGLFIYQDPKRGTVYYDILSRKGYILTSSDVKTYTFYQAMLPLCLLLAFFAVSLFHINYIQALLVFLALYLMAALIFRFAFFYKLPEATNWKPLKREKLPLMLARSFSAARLIILAVMLAALAFLMPAYARIDNMEGFNLIAVYIVTFLTCLFLVIVIMALYIKKKNDL